MTTEEMTRETEELIRELLGDGEWHSHRRLVGDLVRTQLSEYAIRNAIRALMSDPMIETDNRRDSYLQRPRCWYRLRTPL